MNSCCANFRDFADSFSNRIHPGLLYRGGSIDYCSREAIGSPATIINLRNEADEELWPETKYIHFQMRKNIEKYDTSQKEVKDWIADVILEISESELPVFIHCKFGRDRTGIIVAVLLRILLGRDADEEIMQDYMRCEGGERNLIELTFKGLDEKWKKRDSDDGWIQSYFRNKRIPVEKLRSRFLSP